MFMQRRGVTTQREYHNREHNFFVIEAPNGRWEITIGDKERATFSHYHGQQVVEGSFKAKPVSRSDSPQQPWRIVSTDRRALSRKTICSFAAPL